MTAENSAKLKEFLAKATVDTDFVFGGRGEPTLSKELVGMILFLREMRPHNRIILETNGYGISTTLGIQSIFSCGVNLIDIHDINDFEFNNDALVAAELLPFRKLAEGEDYDPILHCQSKLIRTHKPTQLVNCQNSIAPETEEKTGACKIPFEELFIRYDLFIGTCEFDMAGNFSHYVGAYQTPLEAFNSLHLRYLRDAHLMKCNLPTPCDNCSGLCYGAGTTAKLHQEASKQPVEYMRRHEKTLSSGGFLTKTVKRDFDHLDCDFSANQTEEE